MKTYAEYDVRLPDYSLSYLVNADSSGMETEEIQEIDDYMSEFYEEAGKVNGSVVISVPEDESYFTWNPAFGLACNVYDCKIIILVND